MIEYTIILISKIPTKLVNLNMFGEKHVLPVNSPRIDTMMNNYTYIYTLNIGNHCQVVPALESLIWIPLLNNSSLIRSLVAKSLLSLAIRR
jgi:hypothetical protein